MASPSSHQKVTSDALPGARKGRPGSGHRIDRRLVRTGLYLTASAVLLVAFKGTEWAIDQALDVSRTSGVVAALAVAIALGVVFQAFHQRVEHAVERLLNRGLHERREGLEALSKEIGLMRDPATLKQRVVERLGHLLQTQGAALYLRHGEDDFTLAAHSADGATLPERLSADDPAVLRLRLRPDPLVPAKIGSVLEGSGPMLWPVMPGGKLVGLLVCGERGHRESLDAAEVAAVGGLAEALGTALALLEPKSVEGKPSAASAIVPRAAAVQEPGEIAAARAMAGTTPRNTVTAIALPDRPSLVVLPFQNLSDDPEQEYFADGITEDLTAALSRVRSFSVVARNSAFTYKGRATDVRQVGRELGVRYVLEGSVRRAGRSLRITGQLIEAETGHHVWADRFEGSLEDVFGLQDRVTEAVAGNIEPSLQAAEIRRAQAKPTESLDAYDLYLRALPYFYPATPDECATGLALLRRAVDLDPGFTLAKATIAFVWNWARVQGWATPDDLAEAVRLGREVLAEGTDDPFALGRAANAVAILGGDFAAGIAAVERARTLAPNSAQLLIDAAFIYAYACEPAIALPLFQRALRLSPLDPRTTMMQAGMAHAHLVAGDDEAALDVAERVLRLRPDWGAAHRAKVVALWRLGRQQEAREGAARLLAVAPGTRAAAMARPYRKPAFRSFYAEALLAAGVPE